MNIEETPQQPRVVSVSPFRCRMWEWHDRLEHYITEDSCRDEIESVKKHGLRSPVLGRRLHGDPEHDIELIYGARRLFVARYLNTSLPVELRTLTDVEAIVAMDIENRLRHDISPYERGLSYARWLRSGLFTSQQEIARQLKISNSQVSRLLKLARLPSVVVNAFAAPAEICEGWGIELTKVWEDTAKKNAMSRRARAIGGVSPRPPAPDVFRELMAAAAPGRKVRAKTRDEVVKSDAGEPLFRIRYQRNSVALVIPLERMGSATLARIRTLLKDELHPGISQLDDSAAIEAVMTHRVPSTRTVVATVSQ